MVNFVLWPVTAATGPSAFRVTTSVTSGTPSTYSPWANSLLDWPTGTVTNAATATGIAAYQNAGIAAYQNAIFHYQNANAVITDAGTTGWPRYTPMRQPALELQPPPPPWPGPIARAPAAPTIVRNRTPAEVAAEMEAAERAIREAQEDAAARAARAQEATARAERLLLAFLDAGQREQYRRNKTFIVVAKQSGRPYLIRPGKAHNVDLIDSVANKIIENLCFHPENQHELPTPDVMLAQALALRHDEDGARRVANITRHYS